MWSFAKDTEKKVEDLYSDIKKVYFLEHHLFSVLNIWQAICFLILFFLTLCLLENLKSDCIVRLGSKR